MVKISICIPIHNMQNAIRFLERNLNNILIQTFRDYEIVISDDSPNNELKNWLRDWPVKYFRNEGQKGMANNTNHAIDMATGELVKILYMDDYFFDDNSLKDIVKNFSELTKWQVTSCIHTMDGKTYFNIHRPYYSFSENTIGSPSVLTFRRDIPERFDSKFSWVLDLDLYRRLYKKYGKPRILDNVNIIIGLHKGQMTNILTEEQKQAEFNLLAQKYD